MRRRGEDGTGLIASTAGIMVFLVLLLLAVQVLFNLYATSAVTAAAYDAARIVAGADVASGAPSLEAARADAEAGAQRTLGRYSSRTRFDWNVDDPDVVQLHVVAQNPGFLPIALRRPLGFDRVDRTVRVRVERVR
ncbi:MAG: hypothetical protein QOG03_884 [Actinomycetota bacterium]|nr:hypothetical protein [Actinomycetota bacterium]